MNSPSAPRKRSPLPSATRTTVPGKSGIGSSALMVVKPVVSSMWSTRRCPRVSTTSDPCDAATAPATTRKPLPSIPRSGKRRSLLDNRGRLTEKSFGTIAGAIVGDGVFEDIPAPDPGQGDVPGAGIQSIVDELL